MTLCPVFVRMHHGATIPSAQNVVKKGGNKAKPSPLQNTSGTDEAGAGLMHTTRSGRLYTVVGGRAPDARVQGNGFTLREKNLHVCFFEPTTPHLRYHGEGLLQHPVSAADAKRSWWRWKQSEIVHFNPANRKRIILPSSKVSVCKALSLKRHSYKKTNRISGWFFDLTHQRFR